MTPFVADVIASASAQHIDRRVLTEPELAHRDGEFVEAVSRVRDAFGESAHTPCRLDDLNTSRRDSEVLIP